MYNIAVIGIGQLGSRYLQGLKKVSNIKLNIWAIDNNDESLTIGKSRYEEISPNPMQQITFSNSILDLPQTLDLLIISTNSKQRLSVLKDVIHIRSVKNLILEKFLFPNLGEYAEAETILTTQKINTWVNCPKRIYSYNQDIQTQLDSHHPIIISFKGTNWGLCCNSIHFIDLFLFFTQETSFEVNTEGLQKKIYNSKRNGYIELQGTLIVTAGIHQLTLTSTDDSCDNTTSMTIENNGHIFSIDFTKNTLSKGNENPKTIHTPLQSEITESIVSELLTNNRCELPIYQFSSASHVKLLKALINFTNSITGSHENGCPIT